MSDYSMCACDYADDEVVLYNARIVTARKTYYCDECHVTISPGDRYEYVFGAYRDGTFTARTCIECVDGPLGLVSGDVEPTRNDDRRTRDLICCAGVPPANAQ